MRYEEFFRRLAALFAAHEDIRCVLLVGSRARTEEKADEYSDVDLLIICDEPERLTRSDAYVGTLGHIRYSFIEPTVTGGMERRVLFNTDEDVDIIPVSTADMERLLAGRTVDALLVRGYKVLHDRMNVGARLSSFCLQTHPRKSRMPEAEFANLVNDFLFHTVWAEKKIARGELWTAAMCVDAYLKGRLLAVIEEYTLCTKGAETDVWHNGRLLERWAEPAVLQALEGCFARYDATSLRAALRNTKALFVRLAAVCAEESGYTVPALTADKDMTI